MFEWTSMVFTYIAPLAYKIIWPHERYFGLDASALIWMMCRIGLKESCARSSTLPCCWQIILSILCIFWKSRRKFVLALGSRSSLSFVAVFSYCKSASQAFTIVNVLGEFVPKECVCIFLAKRVVKVLQTCKGSFLVYPAEEKEKETKQGMYWRSVEGR